MFTKLKIKLKGAKFRRRIFWKDVFKIFFLQILIFSFFFGFEKALKISPISIPENFPQSLLFIMSAVLFSFFIFIAILSFKKLSPKKVAKEELKTSGIYSYTRHPFYGAIVFFLNPAIAIFLRSWGMLTACIVCFYLWKWFVKEEEERLTEKFGKEYHDYKIKTSRLFLPRVFETAYSRKKALFYVLISFSSFLIVIIGFNIYTEFEAKRAEFSEQVFTDEISIINNKISDIKITPPTPSPTRPAKNYKRRIDKNAYKNGKIKITRIGVEAPIVFVNSTKYLDYYHKYGVVHYPKTSTPGKGGAMLLSGHSSGPPNVRGKYDYVFSKLNSLRPGDKVTIYYEGTTYKYRIFRKEIVWPKEAKLREYKRRETISLLSCWPVGTNSRRIIVEAQRIR